MTYIPAQLRRLVEERAVDRCEYCLLPTQLSTLDQLFDRGLISFDDQGQILFASQLNPHEIQKLGLSCHMKLQMIRSGHRYFLQYHRDHLFLNRPTHLNNCYSQ